MPIANLLLKPISFNQAFRSDYFFPFCLSNFWIWCQMQTHTHDSCTQYTVHITQALMQNFISFYQDFWWVSDLLNGKTLNWLTVFHFDFVLFSSFCSSFLCLFSNIIYHKLASGKQMICEWIYSHCWLIFTAQLLVIMIHDERATVKIKMVLQFTVNCCTENYVFGF